MQLAQLFKIFKSDYRVANTRGVKDLKNVKAFYLAKIWLPDLATKLVLTATVLGS